MNMKNLFLLLVCGLCFQSVGSFAQGYKIQVNIPQMSNKQVILANYFEGKVYAVDTAQINSNGTGYFQKNNKNHQYQYSICINLIYRGHSFGNTWNVKPP